MQINMSQIIIALSGRKGSGKNTVGQFIEQYYINCCLRTRSDVETPIGVDSPVFICSFADNLKEFCINTLGLSMESCYGSDEQKNAPTQYVWENAPKFLRWKFGDDPLAKHLIKSGCSPDVIMDAFYPKAITGIGACDYPPDEPDRSKMKSGPMSGRDIMQLFGTDLIRHTFGNVWAAATIRTIHRNGKPLNVIVDNRFQNEIEVVLKEPKGYIIRLTRSPFGTEDVHPSESALDNYNWNQKKHFVLDNKNMTVEEQNEAIKPILNTIFSG
jgi:hypothetical protein